MGYIGGVCNATEDAARRNCNSDRDCGAGHSCEHYKYYFPCNYGENSGNCDTRMEPSVSITNFNAFGKMKLYADSSQNIAPLMFIAPQRKYRSWKGDCVPGNKEGESEYHVHICIKFESTNVNNDALEVKVDGKKALFSHVVPHDHQGVYYNHSNPTTFNTQINRCAAGDYGNNTLSDGANGYWCRSVRLKHNDNNAFDLHDVTIHRAKTPVHVDENIQIKIALEERVLKNATSFTWSNRKGFCNHQPAFLCSQDSDCGPVSAGNFVCANTTARSGGFNFGSTICNRTEQLPAACQSPKVCTKVGPGRLSTMDIGSSCLSANNCVLGVCGPLDCGIGGVCSGHPDGRVCTGVGEGRISTVDIGSPCDGAVGDGSRLDCGSTATGGKCELPESLCWQEKQGLKDGKCLATTHRQLLYSKGHLEMTLPKTSFKPLTIKKDKEIRTFMTHFNPLKAYADANGHQRVRFSVDTNRFYGRHAHEHAELGLSLVYFGTCDRFDPNVVFSHNSEPIQKPNDWTDPDYLNTTGYCSHERRIRCTEDAHCTTIKLTNPHTTHGFCTNINSDYSYSECLLAGDTSLTKCGFIPTAGDPGATTGARCYTLRNNIPIQGGFCVKAGTSDDRQWKFDSVDSDRIDTTKPSGAYLGSEQCYAVGSGALSRETDPNSYLKVFDENVCGGYFEKPTSQTTCQASPHFNSNCNRTTDSPDPYCLSDSKGLRYVVQEFPSWWRPDKNCSYASYNPGEQSLGGVTTEGVCHHQTQELQWNGVYDSPFGGVCRGICADYDGDGDYTTNYKENPWEVDQTTSKHTYCLEDADCPYKTDGSRVQCVFATQRVCALNTTLTCNTDRDCWRLTILATGKNTTDNYGPCVQNHEDNLKRGTGCFSPVDCDPRATMMKSNGFCSWGSDVNMQLLPCNADVYNGGYLADPTYGWKNDASEESGICNCKLAGYSESPGLCDTVGQGRLSTVNIGSPCDCKGGVCSGDGSRLDCGFGGTCVYRVCTTLGIGRLSTVAVGSPCLSARGNGGRFDCGAPDTPAINGGQCLSEPRHDNLCEVGSDIPIGMCKNAFTGSGGNEVMCRTETDCSGTGTGTCVFSSCSAIGTDPSPNMKVGSPCIANSGHTSTKGLDCGSGTGVCSTYTPGLLKVCTVLGTGQLSTVDIGSPCDRDNGDGSPLDCGDGGTCTTVTKTCSAVGGTGRLNTTVVGSSCVSATGAGHAYDCGSTGTCVVGPIHGVMTCKQPLYCDFHDAFRWAADARLSDIRRKCEDTHTHLVGLQAPGVCDAPGKKVTDVNTGAKYCPLYTGDVEAGKRVDGFDGFVAANCTNDGTLSPGSARSVISIPCYNDADCPQYRFNNQGHRDAFNGIKEANECYGGSGKNKGDAEQFPADRTSFYVSHKVIRPSQRKGVYPQGKCTLTGKECTHHVSQNSFALAGYNRTVGEDDSGLYEWAEIVVDGFGLYGSTNARAKGSVKAIACNEGDRMMNNKNEDMRDELVCVKVNDDVYPSNGERIYKDLWEKCTDDINCGYSGKCEKTTSNMCKFEFHDDCAQQEYAVVHNRYLRAVVAGQFDQTVDFRVISVNVKECDGYRRRKEFGIGKSLGGYADDDELFLDDGTRADGFNDGCTPSSYNQVCLQGDVGKPCKTLFDCYEVDAHVPWRYFGNVTDANTAGFYDNTTNTTLKPFWDTSLKYCSVHKTICLTDPECFARHGVTGETCDHPVDITYPDDGLLVTGGPRVIEGTEHEHCGAAINGDTRYDRFSYNSCKKGGYKLEVKLRISFPVGSGLRKYTGITAQHLNHPSWAKGYKVCNTTVFTKCKTDTDCDGLYDICVAPKACVTGDHEKLGHPCQQDNECGSTGLCKGTGIEYGDVTGFGGTVADGGIYGPDIADNDWERGKGFTGKGTWRFNKYGFGEENFDDTTAELLHDEHRTTQIFTISTDCIDIAEDRTSLESDCAVDAFLRHGDDFSLQFEFSACEDKRCLAGSKQAEGSPRNCHEKCVDLRHDMWPYTSPNHRGLEYPGGSRYFPLSISIAHSECPSGYNLPKEDVIFFNHTGIVKLHYDNYGYHTPEDGRKALSRERKYTVKTCNHNDTHHCNYDYDCTEDDGTPGLCTNTTWSGNHYRYGQFMQDNNTLPREAAPQRDITQAGRYRFASDTYGQGETVVASLETNEAFVANKFTLWNQRVRLCRFGTRSGALAATAQPYDGRSHLDENRNAIGCDTAPEEDVYMLVVDGKDFKYPVDYFRVQSCKYRKLQHLYKCVRHRNKTGNVPYACRPPSDRDQDDKYATQMEKYKHPFGYRSEGVDFSLCPDVFNDAYTSNAYYMGSNFNIDDGTNGTMVGKCKSSGMPCTIATKTQDCGPIDTCELECRDSAGQLGDKNCGRGRPGAQFTCEWEIDANKGRPQFGAVNVTGGKGAAWDAISFVTDYMINDADKFGTNQDGVSNRDTIKSNITNATNTYVAPNTWWVVDMEGILVDCSVVQADTPYVGQRRLRSVQMHTRNNKDQVDEKDVASVALVVKAKFTDIKTINDQGKETADKPDGYDDQDQRDEADGGDKAQPLAEIADKWQLIGIVGIIVGSVFILGMGVYYWNKRNATDAFDVESKYRPQYRPNLLIPRKMIEPSRII